MIAAGSVAPAAHSLLQEPRGGAPRPVPDAPREAARQSTELSHILSRRHAGFTPDRLFEPFLGAVFWCLLTTVGHRRDRRPRRSRLRRSDDGATAARRSAPDLSPRLRAPGRMVPATSGHALGRKRATDLTLAREQQPPAFTRRIADPFTSTATAPEIYIMNATAPTRSADRRPAVDQLPLQPDGSASSSRATGRPAAQHEIYVMNATLGADAVTFDRPPTLAVSADGSQIASLGPDGNRESTS